MPENLEPIPYDERRSFQRVATQRDVIFSDYDATGPLREGQVVDMSAGGLRIITRSPETPGTDIQMELQPTDLEPDASVVLLEGRVMHVVPVEDGQYAMGVRRLQRGMASSGATPRPHHRGTETPRPTPEKLLQTKHQTGSEPGAMADDSIAGTVESTEMRDAAQPVYRYPTPRPNQRKMLGFDIARFFIGLFVIVFTVTAAIIVAVLL